MLAIISLGRRKHQETLEPERLIEMIITKKHQSTKYAMHKESSVVI